MASALVAGVLALAPGASFADVVLTGTSVDTAVSGRTGSVFVTEGAESSSHAMYGISSRERSDEPCQVSVYKEHVNDDTDDTQQNRNLCGPNGPNSWAIIAQYSDGGVNGDRTFITGIRVCMNNDKTRVKGFKIRGKRIDNSDHLVDITGEPVSTRVNCDEEDGWMSWAECPVGKVATAARLHFNGGSEPRSLVGIALTCRTAQPQ